jgi:hypothetical protein
MVFTRFTYCYKGVVKFFRKLEAITTKMIKDKTKKAHPRYGFSEKLSLRTIEISFENDIKEKITN